MLGALQLLTIIGMIGATFLVYQSLGPRRRTFTYTREEKKDWDLLVSKDLGNWLTASNIFASITSLATVYIFFIGNTHTFGWWMLVPIATIWAGAFVTNYFTRRLVANSTLATRLKSAVQSGGVILAIFLDGSQRAVHTTSVIRYLSLANIFALLWMEFSVFADISSRLIWGGNLLAGAALLFVCAFAVIYFTIRYGLRGFVFADLFQCPLMALGSLALFIGAVFVLATEVTADSSTSGAPDLLSRILAVQSSPEASWIKGGLFALSVVFLNSFLVLVTQPHWLRVWMFGKKETQLQVTSLSITSGVWLLLVLIGALASVAVTDQRAKIDDGMGVVVFFLRHLADVSPLFAVAFWIAGMAALFSTSDGQIYSFLLIERFDPRTGTIGDPSFATLRPAYRSAVTAALFALIYGLVRLLEIPFDQLVLVLLPSCLNIVPPLVLAVRGVPQAPAFLWTSLVLYGVCAVLGLMAHPNAQIFAVAAPLMSMLVSAVAFVYATKEVEHVRPIQQL